MRPDAPVTPSALVETKQANRRDRLPAPSNRIDDRVPPGALLLLSRLQTSRPLAVPYAEPDEEHPKRNAFDVLRAEGLRQRKAT
jgi:hypothetical protein